MSSTLQNRLVGTVIIVALAVIFLPELLDGKKQTKNVLFESIPPIPSKKPIVDPEPFPIERVEQATHRPIEIVNEESQDSQLIKTTSQADRAILEQSNSLAADTVIDETSDIDARTSWVIQLGSFRDKKNVNVLLDKLEKAGYRAFSRPIKTQTGWLTKVFVGPDIQKSKLDNAITHLAELTGLDGRVTRFTVQS